VVSGTNTGSIFLKNNNSKTTAKGNSNNSEDIRQKIRLVFDSPDGYQRELLAGVDARTTDNFDLGFDAILLDVGSEDMYWDLNNTPLVIQAVANFNESQILPLGLKVSKAGTGVIKIEELLHIENSTNIYLHDKDLNIYHDLKQSEYSVTLSPGEYKDRFEITFSSNAILSTNDIEYKDVAVEFYNNTKDLVIQNPKKRSIQNIEVYNLLGQSLKGFDKSTNASLITHKIKHLSTGVYIVKIALDNEQFISHKISIE
jgi:hypothetical protein